MSLFGSFFGMDDPFMMGASQMMREMDSMANAMMRGSFPAMGGPMMLQSPQQQLQRQSRSLVPFGGMGSMMMSSPFGFSSMGGMFGDMGGNCQVYSSSSVTTISTGPDGRPMVYQASSSSRAGPGGVRETSKTVSDSRTGVRKMAVGRHLGERSHVREKEQNLRTGEVEEREDLINLDEEEVPEFEREWHQRARAGPYSNRPALRSAHGYVSAQEPPRPLAITAGPSSRSSHSSQRERSFPKQAESRSGKRQRTGK